MFTPAGKGSIDVLPAAKKRMMLNGVHTPLIAITMLFVNELFAFGE